MTPRRPPATPDELLDSLPDVHPSMVPAYLAEATVRVLVEIRDQLRAGAGALVPEQRGGRRLCGYFHDADDHHIDPFTGARVD